MHATPPAVSDFPSRSPFGHCSFLCRTGLGCEVPASFIHSIRWRSCSWGGLIDFPMQEGPHFFECVKPLPIMRIEGKHSCKVFPHYRYNDHSSAFQIGTGGLEAVAIRAGIISCWSSIDICLPAWCGFI